MIPSPDLAEPSSAESPGAPPVSPRPIRGPDARLSLQQQAALVAWLKATFIRRKGRGGGWGPHTESHEVKDWWGEQPGGFYVTGLEMKAALLDAGLAPSASTQHRYREEDWWPLRLVRRGGCTFQGADEARCGKGADLKTGICAYHRKEAKKPQKKAQLFGAE